MSIEGFEHFHESLTIFNGFEDFQLFSLKKQFLLFPFFVVNK